MKKGFLLVLLCMVFLSGCWDMTEINDIGLVMAVGIDKSEKNPNNYLVTVQLANPKGGSSSGQQSQAQTTVWVASAEGKTIFEAIRKLAQFSSHRIMWAHNNIIIIGESLAKDDITPVINFFTHNHELRMKTLVVVGKGKASDFLVTSVGMGNIPGQTIADLFRNQKFTGLALPSSMLKIFEKFTSENSNLLLTTLSFDQAVTQPDLKKKADNTQIQIKIAGAAVFNNTKMLGYLSEDEARGLGWILNRSPNIIVSVPEPGNSSKFVAVEVNKISPKIITQLDDDMPIFTINISGVGNISEEDYFTDLSMNEFKTNLEAALDEQIAREVKMSLTKVQKQYKSDVLGFGDYIHMQHKKEWNDKIKAQWKDIFPEAEVRVNVKIDIKSSSLNQIPFHDSKKGSSYGQD